MNKKSKKRKKQEKEIKKNILIITYSFYRSFFSKFYLCMVYGK